MHSRSSEKKAFTLVELMVSTAIIGLIMIVLVSMTNQMSTTWRSSTAKIERFQSARDGFEAMTRRIAQATLNNYLDYLDANGNPRPSAAVNLSNYNSFTPVTYGRTSSLRIISGPMYGGKGSPAGLTPNVIRPTHGIFFQAPFGLSDLTNTQYNTLPPDRDLMNNALNTWGYFVEAGFDSLVPAFISQLTNQQGLALVKPRWRSRLKEFRQPTEAMNLYDQANAGPTDWYTIPLNNANTNPTDPTVRVLAENVIALVFMPKLSKLDENNLKLLSQPWQLCPWYIYDSTLVANPGVTAPATQTAPINPKNQLPPIINVTMVALDELSAKKLDEKYGTGPNGTGTGSPYMGLDQAGSTVGVQFTNLFTDQTSVPLEGPLTTLQNIQQNPSDLNNLQQILIKQGLTYRIFTSNVTIRGAKWSRLETN